MRRAQGALRFAETEGGPFLREEGVKRIPPLVELPKLLSAAEHVMEDKDTEEDLRLLFAPGSSLGGARPKRPSGRRTAISRLRNFRARTMKSIPSYGKRWRSPWRRKPAFPCPIAASKTSPASRCCCCDASTARASGAFPFLSAMSMLGSKDNETRSYLEIVDALRQHGAAPKADMEALWRRMVFNILISNTDDHLRNHGFLYAGQAGWRLSPAYDLNPVPTDIKPRILSHGDQRRGQHRFPGSGHGGGGVF